MKNVSKKAFIVSVISLLTVVGLGAYAVYRNDSSTAPSPSPQAVKSTPPLKADADSEEAYEGKVVKIADIFTVKVPNGWSASVSEKASFTAIMFSRPEKLSSLSYKESEQPAVDYAGIPSWSGLTEHFFILAPTVANEFKPAQHQEISSMGFIFDDKTNGVKYDVVKHAEEAKKWGGLLRDNEWQGRTYIYKKDGRTVEAHLALYPSHATDIDFFEKVVRTISAAK